MRYLKTWMKLSIPVIESKLHFGDFCGGYNLDSTPDGHPLQPDTWCSFFWSFDECDPVVKWHESYSQSIFNELGTSPLTQCVVHTAKYPEGFGCDSELIHHSFPDDVIEFMRFFYKTHLNELISKICNDIERKLHSTPSAGDIPKS